MNSLKEFHIRPEPPQLCGGLGRGYWVDDFAAIFGTHWKSTPFEGVWYIGTNGCQFTIRALPPTFNRAYLSWDIAWYDFPTLTEFKELFKAQTGETAGNATYFTSNPKYKYLYLDIKEIMENNGVDLYSLVKP